MVYDTQDAHANSLPEYDILREYDANGRLVRTALPKKTLKTAQTDPATNSFLVTNQDRIGFYSDATNDYIEIALSGDVVGRWRFGIPLEKALFTGAALTSSGAVYLGFWDQTSSTPQGLLLYRLDKSSGMFVKQGGLSTIGPTYPTRLLGSDGDKLVFYSKPPASVSWFHVQ